MDYGKIYNAEYYKTSCGEVPYEQSEIWYPHFEIVADRIIKDINPRTVLDVGCAMGYLVAALRDKGVEAYGIDVSEYAISKVREDIKPYCRACSALNNLPEEFPKKYDLLITVEVAEHMYEEDSIVFIEKITEYAENILFSSTPDDIMEITHYNVQQPEYWCKKFANKGFYRKLEYDATYISPVAVMFNKYDKTSIRIVEDYEKNIRVLKANLIKEYEKVCNNQQAMINQLQSVLRNKEEQINNLELASRQKDKEIEKYYNDLEKINKDISQYKEELVQLNMYKSEVEIYKSINIKLENELQEQKKQLQEQKNELDLRSDELDNVFETIGKRDDEISEYSKIVAYYNDQKNLYESKYFEILNSTCWKITLPMRKVITIVRFIFVKNPLTIIMRKVIKSILQNGYRKTFSLIKAKILKRNVNDTIVITETFANQNSDVSNLVNQRFRNMQAISHIEVKNKIARLNLVTDSIDNNSLLGGVATALIVATEFARYCDIPLRIITRNTPVNPTNYKNIIKMSGLHNFNNVEFYSDYDRDIEGNTTFKLEVTESDIFFATSWWSAVAIQKTTLRKKFFYIIQEVETFFYPHGEEHYLCSSVMENKDIDFIINSKYLYQYFKVNNANITNNGIYFNPAFSQEMYKPCEFKKKTKYKLFFYARPNNPRNMFYYGIELLDYCISLGILDTSQWEIYCAGQDIPEIKFSNGYKAIDKGLMSWKDYGEFLSGIDLAVSLMYTPHPSYPPYDVACSGGVVLTNTCLNKVDFEECKNIILVDLEKEKFSIGMKEALELALDMPRRKKNYEESMIPRKWQNELNGAIEFMREKI